MTLEESIRKNAELLIEHARTKGELGRAFGYTRESVKWVDNFIERQRTHGYDEAVENLIQVIGSYLGESIIHVYGGTWKEWNNIVGVFFDDGNPNANAVFPFNKVQKQFRDGA